MTSTSPAFLQAGEDLNRCSERPRMCVHAHLRMCVWCGTGAELSGQTGSGLFNSENVQASRNHRHSPLRCTLAFSRCPPDTTAINGVVCVDTAALSFSILRVLPPRAPLLIRAHLPPQGRQIKFLFQHWGGGGGVVVNRDRLWQSKSDVPQRLPGTASPGNTVSAQLAHD